MLQGRVKWYNAEKGYGFIEPHGGGPDYYVLRDDIVTEGYKALHEDQAVEFETAQGPKGPQAVNVKAF